MRAGGHQERGFVLISVLWLMAILTVITVGFGRRAMLDAKASAYAFDHAQAMFHARAAVERGMVELRNSGALNYYYRQEGYTGLDQQWAQPKDLYDDGIFVRAQGFEGDVSMYTIVDEDRWFGINAADDEVLSNAGLNSGEIRKINYRREPDEDGDPPQLFSTLEEMRAMLKIDDDKWFGEKGKAGICDVLTLWGTGQVNINTASEDVLKCIPDLDDASASRIVTYRAGADGELGTADDVSFKALEEVESEASVNGNSMEAVRRYCKVYSQFFTITGVATQRNGAVAAYAQAVVDGSGGVLQWREEPLGR